MNKRRVEEAKGGRLNGSDQGGPLGGALKNSGTN